MVSIRENKPYKLSGVFGSNTCTKILCERENQSISSIKAQAQEVELMLVTPVWKTQSWYAVLLSPVTKTEENPFNPQLVVSNQGLSIKLHSSFSFPGGPKQISPATHILPNGIAGVLNKVQIHFQDL